MKFDGGNYIMKRILSISIFTVSIFAIVSFIFMSFKSTYDASGNTNYPFKDGPKLKHHESFSVEGNRAILINLENNNSLYFPSLSEDLDLGRQFDNFSDELIRENHFYIDFMNVYNNEDIENTSNYKRVDLIFNNKTVPRFDNFSSYEEVEDYKYRFYDLTPEIIKNADATDLIVQSFKNKDASDKDSIERMEIHSGNYYITTAQMKAYRTSLEKKEMGTKAFFYEHPLFDEAYLMKQTLPENFPLWSFTGFKKLDTPIEFYDLSDANSVINDETCEEFKDAYTYQVFVIYANYYSYPIEGYRSRELEYFTQLRFNKNVKDLFIDKNEMKALMDSVQIKK